MNVYRLTPMCQQGPESLRNCAVKVREAASGFHAQGPMESERALDKVQSVESSTRLRAVDGSCPWTA